MHMHKTDESVSKTMYVHASCQTRLQTGECGLWTEFAKDKLCREVENT